nr:hypothetical protein [Tanacetum cinerariifolium]
GRAEDPSMLTILSDKLDRCMGRIVTSEKDLGTSKQVIGGAILKLVKRVKRLEKQAHLRRHKLVIADSDEEAEDAVAKEDDIDLDEITTLATAALGPEQPVVPTENVEPMEEQEEMEVPLRRKRSTYRRARTQFHTTAFARFRSITSTGVPSQTVVPEPAASYVALDTAGPSVPADKGKAHMPDLDIPAEFLAKDAQARKRLEEEQASKCLVQQLRAEDLAQERLPNISEQRQKELDELMMRMTEADWLNLMTQVGSDPTLARELLGADVNEENFIPRMNAMKERKKRALADLRYRALQNKPLKKSKVTEFMRAFVKGQWGKSICCDKVVFVDTLPDDEITDPRVKLETVSESTSFPPLTRRKHLGERGEAFLCDRPIEDFFSSDSDSDDDDSEYSLPYSEFQDWEVVRCPPGNSYIHVYHREDRRRKYFTYLKELLPHCYILTRDIPLTKYQNRIPKHANNTRLFTMKPQGRIEQVTQERR